MPGRFNVANALGALAAAHALGVPLEVAGRGARARGARARAASSPWMRDRTSRCSSTTPTRPTRWRTCSAPRASWPSARGPPGRVICVFGAGGDRDRGKRPLMGAVAARLADVVIVTSDNPRSEDPERIIAEIMVGVQAIAARACTAPGPGPARRGLTARAGDRRPPQRDRAGRRVRAAGDVLVIAGKGHEQGQELAGGRKLPFDDVAVAQGGAGRAPAGPGRGRRAMTWRDAAAMSRAKARRESRGPRRSPCAHAELVRSPTGARGHGPRGASVDSRSIAAGRAVRRPARRARRRRPLRRAGAARRSLGRAGHARACAVRLSLRRSDGAVLAHDDPLVALQALARAWREELGAPRRACSGDHRLDRQDLDQGHPRGAARRRSCASPQARRTSTPRSGCRSRSSRPAGDSRRWCWRWRCAAPGQIAELTAIAQPDVGVIVNVGPAHLEQLGSLEAIAAAKAELIAGLAPGRERGHPRGRDAARPPSARRPAHDHLRRGRRCTADRAPPGWARADLPRGR